MLGGKSPKYHYGNGGMLLWCKLYDAIYFLPSYTYPGKAIKASSAQLFRIKFIQYQILPCNCIKNE